MKRLQAVVCGLSLGLGVAWGLILGTAAQSGAWALMQSF